MYKILPYPKLIEVDLKRKYSFNKIIIRFNKCNDELIKKIMKILKIKFIIFEFLDLIPNHYNNNSNSIKLNIYNSLDEHIKFVDKYSLSLFELQGYAIKIKERKINIYFKNYSGAINAISTLKQLFNPDSIKRNYYINELFILDYPDIEKRSLSTSGPTWYSGYGRVGFDMQLWGFKQWKEFLEISSDFKINQLNMCMYGYWPFEFKDYPETVFKDFKMKVWNRESKNWLNVKYTHPNLINNFLPELINYAHLLGINIFAYIGLNSYNGGYSNVYKEKRMKLPPGGKFINDFDTLCLSDDSTIKYLKKCVKRITELGFDGIIFEESEESYWFCNCDKCKISFLSSSTSPAEAKHKANYYLLNILHKEIKSANPNCNIGLRAWREEPLEKDLVYLQKCEENIPKDVCLYWAPGLYVEESEFEKWVGVFGRDRICARDTEANAISACTGRLVKIFKENILRPEDETNQQHLNNDLKQHKGSAALKVKGINGYIFEFYGFFMFFFLHSNFGWDSRLEEAEFYDYAIESVFGEDLKDDILFVLKNLFTIHESQINLFTSEFPFMRNKVDKDDIPRIREAQKRWLEVEEKILRVQNTVKDDKKLSIYYKHFEKIENSHRRSKEIYNLCLNAIEYDNAEAHEEKIKFLKLIDYHNERDFDIAKELFFDIGIIDASGIRDSMFPYHELKRVIYNILEPDNQDEKQIYLGVEALGWLWL